MKKIAIGKKDLIKIRDEKIGDLNVEVSQTVHSPSSIRSQRFLDFSFFSSFNVLGFAWALQRKYFGNIL
jgi:hypothetical protein